MGAKTCELNVKMIFRMLLTKSMSLVTGTSRIGLFIRHKASKDVPKQLGR